MALASVDNPKPRGPFEDLAPDAATAPARDVVDATPGTATQADSRASSRFLVRGARKEPLRPPSSPFESLLGDVDRRKQILETELAPWRMICALEIVGQNGL